MADSDSRTEGDRFFPAVPPYAEPYPLKGSGGLDWGMQSRLAMIRAVSAVVHESVKPQTAYDQYSTATRGHNQPEDKR
jgi:hypothetical protein